MMNGMPTMGPMMWVFMLLIWGFVILGLVLAIRWVVMRGKNDKRESRQTPLEVLQLRYARGEIDRETYERIKQELE